MDRIYQVVTPSSYAILGRVDLCCLFLQQFRRHLYKAELIIHSYSIRIGDNPIEMAYKRCPADSFKCALLFVAYTDVAT